MKPDGTLEPVYQHLLGWLRRTTINTEQANATIEGMKGYYRKVLNRLTVDQIAAGEWDFTVCDQGRVHTPLTRLFTEGRTSLMVDGRPLASIDIANSQVIFFNLLYLEHQFDQIISEEGDPNFLSTGDAVSSAPFLSSSAFDPQGVQEEGEPFLSRPFSGPLLSSFAFDPQGVQEEGRAETLQAQGQQQGQGQEQGQGQAQGQDFNRLVQAGKIYDFLLERYNTQNEKTVKRSDFKRLFFAYVLYGDSSREYVKAHPVAKAFREAFPAVWEFILEQKAANWRKLPCRMQERESRFMINQVVKRLMTYHAEIPVLTIHDSILTHPEHMATVQRIMMEEFERLGTSPTLKIENMSKYSTRMTRSELDEFQRVVDLQGGDWDQQ